MTTTTAPSGVDCPKCGTANMWDNRIGKRNPKAPDFKCRDKSCEGVIWPPKNGQPARAGTSVAPAQAIPATNGKQGYTSGGELPGEREAGFATNTETGAPPADRLTRLNAQFALYDVCLAHAHAVAKREFGNDVTDTAVAAMTATLFIAAKDRGLAA